MHAWDGPWPLEIRRRLDRLAHLEAQALAHDCLVDAGTIAYLYDAIVAEFDMTYNPRQARMQEGNQA